MAGTNTALQQDSLSALQGLFANSDVSTTTVTEILGIVTAMQTTLQNIEAFLDVIHNSEVLLAELPLSVDQV